MSAQRRQKIKSKLPLLHQACIDNNPKRVADLIADGHDINQLDNLKFTALTVAIHDRKPLIVKLLLQYSNIDVTIQDVLGYSALHHCVYLMPNLNLLRSLLALGADVNAQDYQGRSPCYMAICMGKKELTEILIATRKIDITLRDKSGKTLLEFAQEKGGQDLAEKMQGQAGLSRGSAIALLSATKDDKSTIYQFSSNPLYERQLWCPIFEYAGFFKTKCRPIPPAPQSILVRIRVRWNSFFSSNAKKIKPEEQKEKEVVARRESQITSETPPTQSCQ